MGKETARNPKVVRFTLRLSGDVNERLERLADAIGQNKGTTASITLSAGLGLLEGVYLPRTSEQVAEDAMHTIRKLRADMAEAVPQEE